MQSTRVFKCTPEFDIDSIFKRLKSAKPIKQHVDSPETGESVPLHTTIEEIESSDNSKVVRGKIKYDFGIETLQRDGKIKFNVGTNTIDFSFIGGSLYFIPFAGGAIAQVVADKMSAIAMGTVRTPIRDCSLASSEIEDFLKKNPHHLTSCWWRNLNIPSISRSGLAGMDIDRTADFKRYDQHGDKGSLRLKLLNLGWTVLINHQASVVFYNSLPRHEMENFVKREIIPRCS